MKRLLAVLLLVASVIIGVFLLNLFLFIRTPSGNTEQSLLVERGMPLGAIVRELEEKEVISNGPLFKAYILFKRAGGRIRAGEYLFPPRIRPNAVLGLLIKGDFATRRMTIPEGWTAREIAAYLGGLQLVDPDRFLERCADQELIRSLRLSVPKLEGYLYPDTYEIYRPRDEEEVIRRLVGRFKEVYSRDFEGRAREVGFSDEEVVTLASMVERETARPDERPLIASVFLNRLKKGMPLASDPTVIYGIADFSGNLTREDLNRPNPYNTYLNTGLPPTPIANPGSDSIRAVLYPATTDYLYFVSRNDGSHQFSATEGEHNAAVRRYQLNRQRQRAETLPAVPALPPAPIRTIPETLSTSP